MNEPLTVGFLPWWPANPYQLLLKQELNKLGVRVIGNPPLSLLRLLIGRDGLDVVHVHWDKCHASLRHLYTGKEGYLTLAFQVQSYSWFINSFR